jgi:hypothetical protein
MDGYTFVESFGDNEANSDSVDLSSAVGANAYGPYLELIASTSADADLLVLHGFNSGGSGLCRPTRLRVAVGGSGSEAPIIDGLYRFHQHTSTRDDYGRVSIVLPRTIPAGSRISVSIAEDTSTGIAKAWRVHGALYKSSGGSQALYSKWQAFGEEAASPNIQGTTVIPSQFPTETWVELVPSLPNDIAGVVLQVSGGEGNFDDLYFGVATGSAGNEVAIVDGIQLFYSTESYIPDVLIPVSVAAGERLSVKSNSSFTNTNIQISILGLIT